MASHSLGLSLHQAARKMGVSFTDDNEPVDRTVKANGLNFHYLEWGDSSKPTLVMLHGVSQQAHSWDFVSLALSTGESLQGVIPGEGDHIPGSPGHLALAEP